MQHVVRISDGLGNQMFQYAFAYALQKETGDTVILDPLFWGTSLRKYQLEEFNIDISRRLVSPALDYILGFGPRNGRRFKDKYRQKVIAGKYETVSEKQIMTFDKEYFAPKTNSFYFGFWQSPAFFDKYYDELKKQFSLKRELSPRALDYKRQIGKSCSVSLHIRRTDYVRDVGDATLDFSFYEEALRQLDEKVHGFDLYIFSDDKEFVRNNFKLRDYTLIEGVSDIDEFELMKACDNHIIANSTFSWWAAYLADNKGGHVYAPCTAIWSKEFYCKEWNLLKTVTGQDEI